MSIINKRINHLRTQMKAQGLDAFIIPSGDPHGSEYVAEHWQFREWVSGFSGSAGVVFVTHDHAGLSTDSRYFLQAEEELSNSEMVLHKQEIAHQPQIIPWLKNNLLSGAKVGIDSRLFSNTQIESYRKSLIMSGLELKSSTDLIDLSWKDRPALPKEAIFELPVKYTGQSRAEKITVIRAAMKVKAADYHLVTTLDDIAWIFNIRGYDVECNPVAICYALIGVEDCILFIDKSKVSEDIQAAFDSEGIKVEAYESIVDQLKKIERASSVLLDSGRTNGFLYQSIHAKIINGPTISTALKAIKNETEVENIKNAMLKDGVALTRLYMWLDETLDSRSVPETEVADRLAAFRKDQGEYYGESFSAIVGYKGNGAIVHYRAKEGSCARIQREGILLLDSGGQYFSGTTDITRTTALSKPTAAQKRNYTLVLKGHIGLATLKFPYGTRGNQMELLARKSLWEYGLNYGHGTGHGVGYFLNVHEGPQALGSGATAKAAAVFEPGMFTSNEPGFYETGEYGIRIENLVLCVEDQKTVYGQFLKFDTLTLFPIDTTLIDFSLLTKEEVAWLNAYHKEVLEKLSPLLNEDERTWMEEKCKAI